MFHLRNLNTQLNKTVEFAFVRKFVTNEPISLQILTWSNKFKEGFLCRTKTSEPQPTSAKMIKNLWNHSWNTYIFKFHFFEFLLEILMNKTELDSQYFSKYLYFSWHLVLSKLFLAQKVNLYAAIYSVYIYIYMCVCVYVFVYIYMCVCVCVCIYIYIYIIGKQENKWLYSIINLFHLFLIDSSDGFEERF